MKALRSINFNSIWLFLILFLFLVQSEIFKALKRTKLLVGDKEGVRYSRCGRTDKGVSSVGQVSQLQKFIKKSQ